MAQNDEAMTLLSAALSELLHGWIPASAGTTYLSAFVTFQDPSFQILYRYFAHKCFFY
jgi:hypothetical protein